MMVMMMYRLKHNCYLKWCGADYSHSVVYCVLESRFNEAGTPGFFPLFSDSLRPSKKRDTLPPELY